MKLINLADLKKLYGKLIKKCAIMYDVDESLIAGIIWQESGGDVKARSHVGAMGLMQLMPATAKDMGVKDAYDPEQNIEGGSKYVAWIRAYLKTDNDVDILAGYNAGIANVKNGRWMRFKETVDYIIKVQQNKYEYRLILNKPFKEKLLEFVKRQAERLKEGIC